MERNLYTISIHTASNLTRSNDFFTVSNLSKGDGRSLDILAQPRDEGWAPALLGPSAILLGYGLLAISIWTCSLSLWNLVDIISAKRLNKWRRASPTLPFGLPVLGHALWFTRDMRGFSAMLKKYFHDIPIRIKLFVIDQIVISSPEDIVQIFKQSSSLTNKPYRKFVSNTFNVPEEFKAIFDADMTGLKHRAQSGDTHAPVKEELRVDYLMHTFIIQFMSGPSLIPMGVRFMENLTTSLEREVIAEDWVEMPDLYILVRDHMFRASVRAMFGEELFRISPKFCDEFWAFEKSVPDLAKGLPRWMNRPANEARDKCLRSVEEWGQSLREQAKHRTADPLYDPVFGAEIVQKRHAAFAKIPNMSSRAIACEDLGLIWASTANAAHAAFWLVYQTLRRPELQADFRDAIAPAMTEPPTESSLAKYSMTSLGLSPLLQSMYTETLRLHVSMIVLRGTMKDIKLRKWTIPRGETLAMMTYPMHRDEEVYSTGSEGDPRSLDEFWAERFLVPKSKSITTTPTPTPTPTPTVTTSSTSSSSPVLSAKDSAREFSAKGLDGSWIPYGGGSNICPGRHFAKQEMLLMGALMLGNYEIDLTGPPVDMAWKFFGTGAMGVDGKAGFRIRKRKVDAVVS